MPHHDTVYDTRIRLTNTRTRLGSVVFRDNAPDAVWEARKQRVFEAEIMSRKDF